MEPQGLTLDMESYREAKSSELAAFEQLILLHERRVLMTALRLLGRLEDAQDAAQEVFLRLHKYSHRFDETRDIVPWLYRMTVNVCHDIRRKRREVPLPVSPELADDRPGPEAVMDLDSQRHRIEAGLETLPEKECAAIVLHDIEGLSTKEVARILGSSETTVRSQVCMARLKLRKFLRRRT